MLTVFLTWPYAPKLARAGRMDTDDGQFSIWNVAWVARTLVEDPLNVFHANAFYPHRYVLCYSELNLVTGALGIPAYLLGGNALAMHNSAVLIGFALATLATYYLARRLTSDRGAASVAAVAFAFCPFVLGHMPHTQLLMHAGLPLSLLSFHRLVDRPSVLRGVELGVVLWLQALSSAYYAIFAGLTIAVGTFYYAATRREWANLRYWKALAVAAAVSIVLVLPFFLPYLDLQRGGFVRTLDDARSYSANLPSYFVSSAIAHRWMLPMLHGWREVLFPGFVSLTLGIAGIVMLATDRSVADTGRLRATAGFYALITVLALWVSFGPNAGLYTALFHALPVFSFLRAPARIGILVSLCLTVLTALFLARTWRDWAPRRRTAAAVGLTALVAAELSVGPLFVQDVGPPPQAHVALAHLPDGAVAEFPFFTRRAELPRHTRYMYLSTYHWHPLINGYSDYFPRVYRRMLDHVDGFPDRASMNELRKRRVRYVILHLQQYRESTRRRLIRKVEALVQQGYLKQHVRSEDGVWLFEVVAWP